MCARPTGWVNGIACAHAQCDRATPDVLERLRSKTETLGDEPASARGRSPKVPEGQVASMKPPVDPVPIRLVGDGRGIAELDESRFGPIDCSDHIGELDLPATDRPEIGQVE